MTESGEPITKSSHLGVHKVCGSCVLTLLSIEHLQSSGIWQDVELRMDIKNCVLRWVQLCAQKHINTDFIVNRIGRSSVITSRSRKTMFPLDFLSPSHLNSAYETLNWQSSFIILCCDCELDDTIPKLIQQLEMCVKMLAVLCKYMPYNPISDLCKTVLYIWLIACDHMWFDAGKSGKKRVIVLGTGWGGMSFLKNLDSTLYDVRVVAPRNYFVFTPLLPSVTSGSVEARSIIEPIRRIVRSNGKHVQFHEAECIKIDAKNKVVVCKDVSEVNLKGKEEFSLEYDYLVVAVGATVNTFGTKGVKEYCHFLKEVSDAEKIRESIVNCFESASLPHLSQEDRFWLPLCHIEFFIRWFSFLICYV